MAGSESSQPPAPRITFIEHEQFLEARLAQVSAIQGVRVQIEEVLRLVAEKKPRLLLVDMRLLSFELTTLDRYGLGILASRFSPHVQRAACIADARFIDPHKFGTQVAQNRGLKIDIFPDADEALRWLLAP